MWRSRIAKLLLLSLPLLLLFTFSKRSALAVLPCDPTAPDEVCDFGRIAAFEPFRPFQNDYRVSECEDSYITGVRLGFRWFHIMEDYYEVVNGKRMPFCYHDRLNDNEWTCKSRIQKGHVYIDTVYCRDGSESEGVRFSQGFGNLMAFHELRCEEGSVAIGIDGAITETDYNYFGSVLGLRLICQKQLLEFSQTALWGLPEPIDWREGRGDYRWYAVTLPREKCDGESRNGGCEIGTGSGWRPVKAAWEFFAGPDHPSRHYWIPLDLKIKRQECQPGFALRTLRHYHGGPSQYNIGGGECYPYGYWWDREAMEEKMMEGVLDRAASTGPVAYGMENREEEEEYDYDEGDEGDEDEEADEDGDEEDDSEPICHDEDCPEGYACNERGICRPIQRRPGSGGNGDADRSEDDPSGRSSGSRGYGQTVSESNSKEGTLEPRFGAGPGVGQASSCSLSRGALFPKGVPLLLFCLPLILLFLRRYPKGIFFFIFVFLLLVGGRGYAEGCLAGEVEVQGECVDPLEPKELPSLFVNRDPFYYLTQSQAASFAEGYKGELKREKADCRESFITGFQVAVRQRKIKFDPDHETYEEFVESDGWYPGTFEKEDLVFTKVYCSNGAEETLSPWSFRGNAATLSRHQDLKCLEGYLVAGLEIPTTTPETPDVYAAFAGARLLCKKKEVWGLNDHFLLPTDGWGPQLYNNVQREFDMGWTDGRHYTVKDVKGYKPEDSNVLVDILTFPLRFFGGWGVETVYQDKSYPLVSRESLCDPGFALASVTMTEITAFTTLDGTTYHIGAGRCGFVSSIGDFEPKRDLGIRFLEKGNGRGFGEEEGNSCKTECQEGEVLAGVGMKAGSFVTDLVAICADLQNPFARSLSDQGCGPYTTENLYCPVGFLVSGFNGKWDQDYNLRSLQLECRPADIENQESMTLQTRGKGAPGGRESGWYTLCHEGSLPVGLTVWAGSRAIQRVGGYCAAYTGSSEETSVSETEEYEADADEEEKDDDEEDTEAEGEEEPHEEPEPICRDEDCPEGYACNERGICRPIQRRPGGGGGSDDSHSRGDPPTPDAQGQMFHPMPHTPAGMALNAASGRSVTSCSLYPAATEKFLSFHLLFLVIPLFLLGRGRLLS